MKIEKKYLFENLIEKQKILGSIAIKAETKYIKFYTKFIKRLFPNNIEFNIQLDYFTQLECYDLDIYFELDVNLEDEKCIIVKRMNNLFGDEINGLDALDGFFETNALAIPHNLQEEIQYLESNIQKYINKLTTMFVKDDESAKNSETMHIFVSDANKHFDKINMLMDMDDEAFELWLKLN